MAKRHPAILAVAVVVLVQAACGAAPTPSALAPTQSPSATAAASANDTPEAAEWAAGDPADPPTLVDPLPGLVGKAGPVADSVYWGGERPHSAGIRPGLILGHLDGTHRILVDLGDSPRWDGMPIISGSLRGVVLVAVERQFVWGLQLVDVDRGEVRQIVEVQEELWDAAIDPQATAVYWLVGGSGTRSGVWRMTLASGEIDRVLEPDPVAWASGNRLAAAVRSGGQLATSDDGRLAVLECYHGCRLRVVDLATGEYDDFAGAAVIAQELYGFVPAGVSLVGGCVLLPSGVVRDRRCPDPDGSVAALEAQQAMGFGVRLPPGWMLEVESVSDAPIMTFEMRALAVSIETGERVLLRALGTLHGQ